MKNCSLSYVITTYNKLSYLKETLKSLLRNIKEDEEIVIADGASTDGTVEFLQELFNQGKIHQFISEPDKGEAHGYNKCFLIAKGELIKIITDDDVFYFPTIQDNKKFMIENPDIDVLVGNISQINIMDSNVNDFSFIKHYELWFRDWLAGDVPNCFFCGLSLMIRRNSLGRLGIFDTSFVHVDLEYSLRITSLKANIAWNTSMVCVAVSNSDSNSQNASGRKLFDEIERLENYYNYKHLLPIERFEKRGFRNILKNIFLGKEQLILYNQKVISLPRLRKQDSINEFSQIYNECYQFLANYNKANASVFLTKNN